MKRFHFKLHAVLILRQRAEQRALEHLGTAARARQAAAEQVTAAGRELTEARRRWLHEMADGCPALRAAQMLEWCRELEQRQEQAGGILQRAELLLAQASQQMLLARQQREVVEKYQDGQRDLYERELLAEERKLIDDLVQRFGSKGDGGPGGEGERESGNIPAGSPAPALPSAPAPFHPFSPAPWPARAESGLWN